MFGFDVYIRVSNSVLVLHFYLLSEQFDFFFLLYFNILYFTVKLKIYFEIVDYFSLVTIIFYPGNPLAIYFILTLIKFQHNSKYIHKK